MQLLDWVFAAFLASGAAVATAAPRFPAAPDCVFSGQGDVHLEGDWRTHPVYSRYDNDVTYRFRGLRKEGKTTIRFTTDFGESAFRWDDDASEVLFWHKGEDHTLRGKYDDVSMYKMLFNPFGYVSFAPLTIRGKSISHAHVRDPGEVGFKTADNVHANGTEQIYYILREPDGFVDRIRVVLDWNFPKVGIVRVTDLLVLTWSELDQATRVAKKQDALLTEYNAGSQTTFTIAISSRISHLDHLLTNANTKELEEGLVSGLFPYKPDSARRLPDPAAPASFIRINNKGNWLYIAGGLFFGAALVALFLRRKKQ